MQAVILAAGMGKRLKDLTKNHTKCMVKVNGVTLIERMLHQLEEHCLSRIVIVVGYEGQKLIDHIATLDIQTPIIYINNPIYCKTNNIYSLALAKELLCQDDTLLFESDLIFEDSVVDTLLKDSRDSLAVVDKYESWMNGTCVKLGEGDSIETFVSCKKFKYDEIKDYYKTVNIYKFSRHFSETYYVPFLEAYSKALGNNEYYEQVLRVITILDDPVIKAKRLNGQLWYEIDNIQDLDIAASMFTSSEEEKALLVQERYGGYWRYPQLLDFCHLVNPYFPPQKLMDEIKASLERLLTQYPSGMKINSLLAAKKFSICDGNIVVGNGAAELIKSIMEQLDGITGFVSPTFNEYLNRYNHGEAVFFVPQNIDYIYTADDLMEYFESKKVRNLIVVNPDNPSGNYIRKNDLLRLINWSKEQNIQLVIDESFVDFADEKDGSIIIQNVLDENPHLYVVKSLSKSYGVPGLRLGILASGNKNMISKIKKDVAIWNVNSFAEFYMQIEEKYNKEYDAALEKIKEERTRFLYELGKINGIRVIPSQANYIMAEITNDIGSKLLMEKLLAKYGLLIKDLSEKMGQRQFVRFAIRNATDNDKLIIALREELDVNKEN